MKTTHCHLPKDILIICLILHMKLPKTFPPTTTALSQTLVHSTLPSKIFINSTYHNLSTLLVQLLNISMSSMGRRVNTKIYLAISPSKFKQLQVFQSNSLMRKLALSGTAKRHLACHQLCHSLTVGYSHF
mgnify:CR=1 FL=1|jgi:hypothetical protein